MKNSFQQEEPSNTSPLKKTDFLNEDFRQTTQTEVSYDSNFSSMFFDSVILGDSKRVTKLFDIQPNYQQDQIKKIIKIQSLLKMYSQKKKYIRMKKCAKQRRHVYQELIDTEKGYLEDLKIIIDNFISYNNTENILPENEQTYLFCNIPQIYGLNVKFFKEIDNVFSKYHPNSCFGQIFEKYIQFFKIYFSYFSDYSQDKIDILCEKYPAFKKKIEDLDETEFRGRGLNGILIKPVQRLPKYALLVKELVKYTWENHPDYESLKKAHQSFLLVTNKIDAQIGNILQNQALFDLQTKFFNNLNINIVESSRKFLINEQVSLLKKGKEQIVNLYMLTDMVVLSKRFQKDQPIISERLIWYHFIDSNSKFICYKEPTSLIILLIFENETYTIICSDLEQKEKIQVQIELIKSQQLQRSTIESVVQEEEKVYPIRVFVKDITRGKSRMIFKTYARYELNIKMPGIEFNTWTRHKKLAKLQKLIFQVYNEKQIQLQGRDCQLFSEKIIDGKLNKLHYDERKIVVEQFLETLLNSQLIKYNPQPFLEKLELPSDFFKMIEISQIQRQKTQTQSQLKF